MGVWRKDGRPSVPSVIPSSTAALPASSLAGTPRGAIFRACDPMSKQRPRGCRTPCPHPGLHAACCENVELRFRRARTLGISARPTVEFPARSGPPDSPPRAPVVGEDRTRACVRLAAHSPDIRKLFFQLTVKRVRPNSKCDLPIMTVR